MIRIAAHLQCGSEVTAGNFKSVRDHEMVLGQQRRQKVQNHMPPKKSGPPAKQTSEEAAKKLDPIVDRPSDKVTSSAAVKREQREPAENIKNDKVAEEPKPSATTSKGWLGWLVSVANKADVVKNAAAPAAVAKPVTDEKKAAAPHPETQIQVIKRPRSI